MHGYWLNLALVVFLILVNGLLAGSEAAFISLAHSDADIDMTVEAADKVLAGVL